MSEEDRIKLYAIRCLRQLERATELAQEIGVEALINQTCKAEDAMREFLNGLDDGATEPPTFPTRYLNIR